MDPRDIFREFFGFNKRNFGRLDTGDDRFPFEEGRDDKDFAGGHDVDKMFDHFHEEMFKQMQQLNQQMEEMFKTFGSFDFQSALPQPSDQPESPRDKMLKPPEDNGHDQETPAIKRRLPSRFGDLFSIPRFESVKPKDRVDRDLDAEVERDGLSKILPNLLTPEPENEEASPVFPSSPKGFSSNSSVSIVTIRGADGKFEQRQTVRNSDGNEETTVTRQVGDRAHSVTTTKDHLGVVKETETFQNMEKDDLKSFEDTWNSQERRPVHPRDEMVLPESDRPKSSILGRLFDFSHWRK